MGVGIQNGYGPQGSYGTLKFCPGAIHALRAADGKALQHLGVHVLKTKSTSTYTRKQSFPEKPSPLSFLPHPYITDLYRQRGATNEFCCQIYTYLPTFAVKFTTIYLTLHSKNTIFIDFCS